MPGVFINYRAGDQPMAAVAIHDSLARRFGADRVFRDRVSIEAGEDYPEALRENLTGADVVVAVIGPRWLDLTDSETGVRRIDQRNDWVRWELAEALRRGIPVVPVRLRDMPEDAPQVARTDLPEDIRKLADLQALDISQRRFSADVERLALRLAALLPAAAPAPGSDYATACHAFAHAPPALSSLLRVRQFSALVEERTQSFVGRDYVLGAIDRTVLDGDFPSGYVVVLGEPGVGKTALLAQLVKNRGYVHHFNVASMGIQSTRAFLENVCAQLIVRYRVDYSALPEGATQDGGFLSQLLSEIGGQPAHRPVVIAIDALDEVDDQASSPGTNVLLLPPSLPIGVFIVATTRPRYDDRLQVERRRDIHLRDDDPQNLADVREYIGAFLSVNRAQLDRRLAGWDAWGQELADVLTDKSEGNFMYLVHVLRDIRDGTLPVDGVDDIHRLPQGLRAYYFRHWRTMRSLDEERFRHYAEPVVCLLASARESVALTQVVDWTRRLWSRCGWDLDRLDRRVVVDVVRSWREFLNAETTEGVPCYRLYHKSFQEFLRDEVGLVSYHEVIVESALAKLPGFSAVTEPTIGAGG